LKQSHKALLVVLGIDEASRPNNVNLELVEIGVRQINFWLKPKTLSSTLSVWGVVGQNRTGSGSYATPLK
jgi:hypothetical protein